jgi:hypothetical protein
VKIIVLGASVASVVMLTACGSPRLVVHGDGAAPAPLAAHQISHDRNGVVAATLEVVSGATTIDVALGDTGGKLFQATTPPDSGLLPQAVVSGSHVSMSLASAGPPGVSALTVVLDPDVVWTVNIDGGATSDVVDGHLGKLAGVTIAAGATSIELTLPSPSGTTTVHETGGASRFVVHAAGTFPAQVRFSGGGGSAVIDGASHSGISGGTAFTPSGWAGAADRYDIEMDAGVSSFTLDRSA